MNLNQVTLPSTDVERSIAFYRLLGLKLIVSALPRYARFECPDGESTLSLSLYDEPPSGVGVSVYFEDPNIDALVERLIERGVAFDELPTDMRYLWREARLRDPDGNRIVLFHGGDNRKHPPWRIDEPD